MSNFGHPPSEKPKQALVKSMRLAIEAKCSAIMYIALVTPGFSHHYMLRDVLTCLASLQFKGQSFPQGRMYNLHGKIYSKTRQHVLGRCCKQRHLAVWPGGCNSKCVRQLGGDGRIEYNAAS